ncbi:MAG: YcjF family protein [Bacteroidales bacterium]|nr:YcjF family protein [Bacteroidales bacterium]
MKKSVISLLAALALILVILLAGNVITIGDKLAGASPVLAWIFYLLLLAALVALVVIPSCRILFAKPFPKLSVDASVQDSPELRAELKGFARSLADNLGDLPPEEAAARRKDLLDEVDHFYDITELRTIIQTELDRRFDKAQAHINQWAKTVFLVTTVSQTGRIDALTSLVINCRMIADVIRCSGYRPTWGQLGKQYTRILATSLFSYYLSDTLDKVEVDPEMLHLNALSKIPLMGTVTKSLLDGTANTLLTLRIGHVTLAYLREGADALSGKAGAKVRRQAMLDAVKSFIALSKDTTIAAMNSVGQKLDAWLNGTPEEPATPAAEAPAAANPSAQ